MLRFLRNILQLLLSPGNGWEDFAQESPSPDELKRDGLMPLLGIAVITVFFGMVYDHTSFGKTLICAITLAGSYFLAIYAGRLFFDLYFERITGVKSDLTRQSNFIIMGLGIMLVFQIIENCLPWNIVFLKFLPVYAILILAKGASYMQVPRRALMRFTAFSACVIVLLPLLIYYIIFLIVI
ncbi:MAG: hypothetical protein K2M55_09490 [Muribaculaceae bacterium]|nr:hypothetical protein [Muribaculaceae bacterium]